MIGFNIDDLKSPEGAMKATWRTTRFVAVALTCFAIILVVRPMPSGKFTAGGVLVDAVLVLALGLGVRNHSRTAAVLLFAYWVLNAVYAAFCLHATFSIFGVLIGIVYFAGMTGAFDYHRRLRDARVRC